MLSFSAYLAAVTRPFLRFVVALLVIALGRSLVVNVQPYLIQRIIDTITHTPQSGIFQAMSGLVMAYVGSGFCFVVLFRSYDFVNYAFVPSQKNFITQKLMRQMMQHSTAFYQRHFAGNLTNKINDVTQQTPDLIKIVTDHFATCFFTLLVVMVNVSSVHPKFAWGLLVWLGLFMGGSLWMLFSSSDYAYRAAEARSHAMGYIVDVMMNMASIRLFARAKHEEILLHRVTRDVCERERARDRFFMKLHFFQGFSFWLFEGVCFWWLLCGVRDGVVSAGQFVLVFTLNLQILDQFWSLGSEIREFWEKKGYITQALRTIYAPDVVVDTRKYPALSVTQGHITFENVQFFYPHMPTLFQDKNLHVQGGQKVGLVGFSGSGKSTFISLILRLYDVTGGRILIDGQDIATVHKDSLYQSIAVVPQETHLFNRSLMENIRYGRLDASDEEVFDAAKRAQIHNFILSLPMGYGTMAGERGSNLSGGQRQRVAIARAILKNAPILILDEATSSVDTVTENELQQAFHDLMRGRTVLAITHRLSKLKDMDRILVFQAGKIVQDGSHDQLMAQTGGLYCQLWAAQKHGLLTSRETPST